MMTNKSRNNASPSPFSVGPEPGLLSPPLPAPQSLDLSSFAPDIATRVDILRLDSIDDFLGGNKWFKLMPWLELARQENTKCILSFGGPHSNHLHALAAAGKRYSFHSIAYVRGGDWLEQSLSPTLQDARDNGMQLEFIGKAEYARRYDPQWQAQLARKHAALVIPEGGHSKQVLPSVATIGEHVSECSQAGPYDWVAVACGTGTTLAGLACGLRSDTQLMGFSVLKDQGSVEQAVTTLLENQSHCADWSVNNNYHFGGYAKINRDLVRFIDRFEECTGVPLDPVYTAKMMAGLIEEIRSAAQLDSGNAPKSVLAIHTGGLQGRRAMEAKMAKMRAAAQ
ncbi:MAG: 1-aminocyclopropane-1-carboxylate deaminase/D-cysteine desulfhydrase [Pseudomonadales bacterium]